MKRSFTVVVDLPPGVDVVMMAEYIQDAVQGWTGGMDPQHPLGCVDLDVVSVACTVSGVPFKSHRSELAMDSIPVRVLNKTGASDSADLIICPHCYAQNFFIYKLKNGHQHIQCANCDTSYCDGTCGRNDAPHSIVAIIEVS